MKVQLINHLKRPLCFTLNDKSTLRLNACGFEGFTSNPIEKDLLSEEVFVAITKGNIRVLELEEVLANAYIKKEVITTIKQQEKLINKNQKIKL